jgi:hypothetical protein
VVMNLNHESSPSPHITFLPSKTNNTRAIP